jgi:hypothetical protein
MPQEHFWKELYRLKFHICLMELLLAKSEQYDRGIKIFLAVTSSASIGGWAIWADLSLIWASAIAASQVLNAVRQYLPFKDRLKSYSGLLNELEDIYLRAESQWLEISTGSLSDVEIKTALNDLRNRRQKAFRKNLPESTIPESIKMTGLAEDKASSYFDNFYPQD